MQEHCESLTTADREHVAELLAGLPGDLHKTPLGDVEAFNVPHASKPSLDKATLDSLSSLLGSTVVKALETFAEEYNTEFDIEGPPVFLHGELNEHHILWDAVNHRLNTIDLSSCNIGDPASDFSELWNYGESFLERVYQLYDGPKYPKLLRRAALFYKARPIYALKYALQEDKWRAQSMKLFKRRWAELA
ncbi:MAG: phosphotransferase [Candidatus Latescibacterota bacterium]|nr:phosphotransferase [Candidatus Latescibacterota bacterium]